MTHSVEYWKDYNESSFDHSGPDDAVYNTDFMEAFNYAILKWNEEADSDNIITHIPLPMLNEAWLFFQEEGGISVNIIQAMICQMCYLSNVLIKTLGLHN